jgi:hypothetical protein
MYKTCRIIEKCIFGSFRILITYAAGLLQQTNKDRKDSQSNDAGRY